jgi:hypothetical protein
VSERLVLDPDDETDGRVEFDLTPFVGPTGPDFGDAVIEAYMAEAAVGQVPVDFRIPNRPVTIPLNLMAHGELTYEDVRRSVQAKAGLFQREGGVLMREVNGTPWYADIVNASLKMGGSTAQALLGVDADAVLTLETLPDWYGEEVGLGTTAGPGEVVTVLDPAAGDHPGRTRIVVTDTDGAARRGVLWAIRRRHYSDASTAAPVYAAEDLTPADVAAPATVSGSIGAQAIQHPSVGENWTPLLSTDVDGVGAMTHTGSYRVWARVQASAGDVRCRLVWDVGDLVNPTPNRAALIPGAGAWYMIDLGAIRVDRSPLGAHQWAGMVQAACGNGAAAVTIDRLWLWNADDAMGSAAIVAPSLEPGVRDYQARDEFSQAAGNLSGKTATIGGNWTTGGDTGDFETSGDGVVTRAAATERWARLGTTKSAAVAQVDVLYDGDPDGLIGVMLRFSDATHNIHAGIGGYGYFYLVGYNGAGPADPFMFTNMPLSPSTWYTVRLAVDIDGVIKAWAYPKGAQPGTPLTAVMAAAATGGALDDGYAGIIDSGGPSGGSRRFDNFASWDLEQDAVVHANRALEFRTDGAFRENADGTGRGVVTPFGDLPRLPAGGLEGRSAELMVKATRGDLATLPDLSADDISVQVFHRPSFLFVPQEQGS